MDPRPDHPRISIVVPLLDERPVLDELHKRLDALACRADLGADLEIVFVDDGSTDGTLELLVAIAASDARVRVLSLSRNFGQAAALAAGIDHASGDAVVVMDADLQDPPEIIPSMVARWRSGADVVHARRSSRRGDPLLKRVLAWVFWRFMASGSTAPMVTDAGEFRLMDRSLLESLRGTSDRGRFLRGLACWAGGRQDAVLFDRAPRHAGRTKYGLARQAVLALAAMTAFTALPLRVMGAAAGLLVVAGLAILGLAGGLEIAGCEVAPAMVFAGVAGACTGLVVASMWLVGEYVHAMGRDVRGLPLYVVSRRSGFPPVGDPAVPGPRDPGAPAVEVTDQRTE